MEGYRRGGLILVDWSVETVNRRPVYSFTNTVVQPPKTSVVSFLSAAETVRSHIEETNMNDAVSDQIVDTLANMHREIEANGINDAVDSMWAHALSMYWKRKLDRRAAPVNNAQSSTLLKLRAG